MTRGFKTTGAHKAAVLGSVATMAVAGTLALPDAAQAQQQTGDGGTMVLEEIIVTAQRRTESMQEVPVTVSTLRGDRFKNLFLSAEDIRALSARIPSLNVESSNGRIAPRFYIRGLGNTDFDLAASQPVSIIVDDVVMENVILKSTPLFDVQGVEVFKGPQGTLFGRNTPAGIVKFDTSDPVHEYEAYGLVTYGNRNTVNSEAAVNVPLVKDVLAFRASGLLQRRDDYIDNAFTGENDALGGFREGAGRFQLLFTPNSQFRALANVHFRDLEGTSAVFRANIIKQGGGLIDDLDRETVFFDEGDNNPQEYSGWGTNLKLEYFGDNFSVTSISALESTSGRSLGDIDGGFVGPNSFFNPANPPSPPFSPDTIPFPSQTQDAIDDLDQFTQELRVASEGSGPFQWQFGGYLFDSNLTITTTPFFVDPSTVKHENTTWAVFGQASYDITPDLTFSAGLRFTDDEKDMVALASPLPVEDQHVSDEKLSWDFSLNYIVNDDVSLYARHARGFRAPTIQGRDIAFFGQPSIAQSETIKSFEGGLKSELLDNRVRFNAAAYYYQIKGQQLSAIGGAGNLVQLVNADKGVGFGIEIDTEILWTEHFSTSIAFAYNDTELKDDTLAVAPCGSGLCTVEDPLDANGNALVDGNPFPQAPKFTFYATAEYRRPISSNGEVFATTDWSVQGETNFFLYSAPEFRTSGDFEGGLRIGYSHNQGQYEIAFFARNITSEENLKGAIDFNNLTGFLNQPRTFGLHLTARLQ